MMIREPAVAGSFYPRDPRACLAAIRQCIEGIGAIAGDGAVGADRRIIGGVVPHAGWMCSGSVAAQVIREIAARGGARTVVIFGAIHVPHGPRASTFPAGAWETPLGLTKIDERLCERIGGQTGLLDADPHAHESEHSIEVEVPFVRHLLPEATIIPVMVPPGDSAAVLGATIGRVCRLYEADVVFLASTDLTHYGPSYQFTPHGVGMGGLAWAKETNDRRMIDLILSMRADDAVPEAMANKNACGPGAVAATIAACKAYGATSATLLAHTTSHEVLRRIGREEARDAVGYAGIVFTA